MVFQYFILGFLLLFAFWKIYDLLFQNTKNHRIKVLEKSLSLTAQFMVEYAYKQIHNRTAYTDVPPEFYEQVDKDFIKWAEEYNNRIDKTQG